MDSLKETQVKNHKMPKSITKIDTAQEILKPKEEFKPLSILNQTYSFHHKHPKETSFKNLRPVVNHIIGNFWNYALHQNGKFQFRPKLVFKKFSLTERFKFIDLNYSIRIQDNSIVKDTIYLPSPVHASRDWEDNYFNFLIISAKKVFFIEMNYDETKEAVYSCTEIEMEEAIPVMKLKTPKNKWNYYYDKHPTSIANERILISVTEELYKSLPRKLKSTKTKDWATAPHLKLDFKRKKCYNFKI